MKLFNQFGLDRANIYFAVQELSANFVYKNFLKFISSPGHLLRAKQKKWGELLFFKNGANFHFN